MVRSLASHFGSACCSIAHDSLVSNENPEDPLLGSNDERGSLNSHPREGHQHQAAVTVPQVLLRAEFRRPLAIVCFSMLCQQLSGVNAGQFSRTEPRKYVADPWNTVLYYSNDILSKTLPELGPYISLGITIVNVLMTFAPMVLIDVCILLR